MTGARGPDITEGNRQLQNNMFVEAYFICRPLAKHGCVVFVLGVAIDQRHFIGKFRVRICRSRDLNTLLFLPITVDPNIARASGCSGPNARRMTTSSANYPMSKYTVTTKSYKELAAEFATGFKNVAPPTKPKPVSQADWLEPYRPHIMKQHDRGVTWKQIADTMAAPPINMPVTEKILRRNFGGKNATAAPLSAAKAQAGTPRPSATLPAGTVPSGATPSATAQGPNGNAPVKSRRLILDPYTNQPITE